MSRQSLPSVAAAVVTAAAAVTAAAVTVAVVTAAVVIVAAVADDAVNVRVIYLHYRQEQKVDSQHTETDY